MTICAKLNIIDTMNDEVKRQLKRLLKISEVLEFMNISRPTLYELIEKDNFPAIKIGNTWFVDPDDLQLYILKKKESHGLIQLSA